MQLTACESGRCACHATERQGIPLTRDEVRAWLEEDRPERLAILWHAADSVRRTHVGDAVHLRGLIEFGNRCENLCRYCGLRGPNLRVTRYRMPADAILECARRAAELGYGTVVLQSGQDPSLPTDWMCEVIRQIKRRTNLAVTLSLGEHPAERLAAWREAGADRYLLRFETSNPAHYARIHPVLPGHYSDRLGMLRTLKGLGYETGSGVLVGFPGQRVTDLVDDIATMGALGLHMIGVGPYVPHRNTPLAREADADSYWTPARRVEMALKVIALVRMLNPCINIPSTTALATLDPEQGRRFGLERGANVVMPNMTPQPYRSYYEVYPGKSGALETAEESHDAICASILAMGRTLGRGRGDSLEFRAAAGCMQEEVLV